MRGWLALLAFIVLLFAPHRTGAEDLSVRLDRLVEQESLDSPVPGLAVAVVHHGRLVHLSTHGEARAGVPLAPTHVFHTASISKTVTALAVAMLAQEGRFSLDARFAELVPEFRMDDPRAGTLTLRQMLSHTSGMPDVEDYGWHDPNYDSSAAEDYMMTLGNRSLLFDPGSNRQYSNLAYDLLAVVVARYSGMPFEDFARTRVLRPAGMLASDFFHPAIPPRYRTSGHEGENPAPLDYHPYNREHAPSSTLNASLIDMVQYARMYLSSAAVDGQAMVSESVLRELWRDQSGDGRNGLAWFRYRDEDMRTVYHRGRDNGYVSRISLYPDQGHAIIILANWDRYDTDPLFFALVREIFPPASAQ